MENRSTKTRGKAGLPLSESMLPFWRLIFKAFTDRMSRSGLSFNAGTVLAYLYVHPEDCGPARLSEEVGAPRQTMTFILDALERLKLAVRHPHATDRRKITVTLTAKGEAKAKAMIEDLLDFENNAFLSTGSSTNVDGVKKWLTAYIDSLTKQNARDRKTPRT